MNARLISAILARIKNTYIGKEVKIMSMLLDSTVDYCTANTFAPITDELTYDSSDCVVGMAVIANEDYATQPMPSIEIPPFDEEDTFLAFEHALGGRLSAVQMPRQLPNTGGLWRTDEEKAARLITSRLYHRQYVHAHTTSLEPIASVTVKAKLPFRPLFLICLSLSCMMVGFDLMALLVLHTH